MPRTTTLLALVLLAAFTGCKDRVREVSRYPYFVTMLDGRWGIALQSLRSGSPNVSAPVVLLQDLTNACEAMKRSYDGPNRDAAIARLEEVNRKFTRDMNSKLDMRFGTTSLLPGVTEKDLLEGVEKAHKDYLEFRSMVVIKG